MNYRVGQKLTWLSTNRVYVIRDIQGERVLLGYPHKRGREHWIDSWRLDKFCGEAA